MAPEGRGGWFAANGALRCAGDQRFKAKLRNRRDLFHVSFPRRTNTSQASKRAERFIHLCDSRHGMFTFGCLPHELWTPAIEVWQRYQSKRVYIVKCTVYLCGFEPSLTQIEVNILWQSI